MCVQDTEPELFLFDCLFGHKFRWLVLQHRPCSNLHSLLYPLSLHGRTSPAHFPLAVLVGVMVLRRNWRFCCSFEIHMGIFIQQYGQNCPPMQLAESTSYKLSGFVSWALWVSKYVVLYSITQWILMDVFFGWILDRRNPHPRQCELFNWPMNLLGFTWKQ